MHFKKFISIVLFFLFVSLTCLNTTVKASTEDDSNVLTDDYFNSLFNKETKNDTKDDSYVLTDDYFNNLFNKDTKDDTNVLTDDNKTEATDDEKKETKEFKILNFKKLLKLNSKGTSVKELQNRLNEYGYSLKADGIFRRETYDAVKNFQSKCELVVDGIVGPNTLRMLNIQPDKNTLFNHSKSNPKPYSGKNYMTVQALETFINKSNAKSKTNYYIWVDLPNTRVNIFKKSTGKWILDKSFLCGPGKASTPTVKGHFTIGNKGSMFRAGSNTICKYWTQFYGNYLFHTVLLDNNGNIQDGRVGVHLSHGCVRLEIENAKYIYYNIPRGTAVWIK